jgi:hypothetical protein
VLNGVGTSRNGVCTSREAIVPESAVERDQNMRGRGRVVTRTLLLEP